MTFTKNLNYLPVNKAYFFLMKNWDLSPPFLHINQQVMVHLIINNWRLRYFSGVGTHSVLLSKTWTWTLLKYLFCFEFCFRRFSSNLKYAHVYRFLVIYSTYNTYSTYSTYSYIQYCFHWYKMTTKWNVGIEPLNYTKRWWSLVSHFQPCVGGLSSLRSLWSDL